MKAPRTDASARMDAPHPGSDDRKLMGDLPHGFRVPLEPQDPAWRVVQVQDTHMAPVNNPAAMAATLASLAR